MSGGPDDFGILVIEEKELYQRAREAHVADWQIGTHANGDVAIDIMLRDLRTASTRAAAA